MMTSTINVKISLALAMVSLAQASTLLPRAGCDIGACIKALTKNPIDALKSCAQATGSEGLNALQDIKCPFTAAGELKQVAECAACTQIPQCGADDKAPTGSPTARSCGNKVGLVSLAGPDKCAQIDRPNVEKHPGDRLYHLGVTDYRFHCGNSALDILNRCYFSCSQCHDQCDNPVPPNEDGFPPLADLSIIPTIFSDKSKKYTVLDSAPHGKKLAKRQRLFESNDYNNFCFAKNGALMVENTDPGGVMNAWRMVWAHPLPRGGQWTCDHIVELNFAAAFFASPRNTADIRFRDIWEQLTNPGDPDARGFLTNILNHPTNLVGVDEEVNRLKYQVLTREVPWANDAWSDKAIAGAYQYLAYEFGPFRATAARAGDLFDRLGGFGPGDANRPSRLWRTFTNTRHSLALRRLDNRIAQLGGLHQDPAPVFQETLASDVEAQALDRRFTPRRADMNAPDIALPEYTEGLTPEEVGDLLHDLGQGDWVGDFGPD